jgi:hypothetical protein
MTKEKNATQEGGVMNTSHDCKESLTVQELRSLLFEMPQEITVRELRRLLYNLEKQDATVYKALADILLGYISLPIHGTI